MGAGHKHSAGEFGNRCALWGEKDRTAGKINNSGINPVDAQVLVESRQKVIRTNSAIDRILSLGIGRTDHLARLNAATSEKHRVGTRPVVTTWLDGPALPLATPPPLLATCEIRGVRPNSPVTITITR